MKIVYPPASALAGSNPSLRDRARRELHLAAVCAVAFGPFLAGGFAAGWIGMRALRR